MAGVNWYSLIPLVFAVPFLVLPVVHWHSATRLGNLCYLLILGLGTAIVSWYLAADSILRSYSGSALALVVVLALFVRSKMKRRSVEPVAGDGKWLRRWGAIVLLTGALFPTLAATWVWAAWDVLTAPPRIWTDPFSEELTPFSIGWVPLDSLSFYPNAIAFALLGAIGLVYWRYCKMELPHLAEDVLRRTMPLWAMAECWLALRILHRATPPAMDLLSVWLMGTIVGFGGAMLVVKGAWPGLPDSDIYPPLDPAKAGAVFYWDRNELSPSVHRLYNAGMRTNWASPFTWLQFSTYFGMTLVNSLT